MAKATLIAREVRDTEAMEAVVSLREDIAAGAGQTASNGSPLAGTVEVFTPAMRSP